MSSDLPVVYVYTLVHESRGFHLIAEEGHEWSNSWTFPKEICIKLGDVIDTQYTIETQGL